MVSKRLGVTAAIGLMCVMSVAAAGKTHKRHHRAAKGAASQTATTPDAAAKPADGAKAETAAKPGGGGRSFIVYEHIHNRGRPDDLTPLGLVPIELCYNTKTKQSVAASVKSKFAKTGGPIVFDIEKTNRGDHNVSASHLKEVVKWAHEAAPGCKVGHYAVGPGHLTPMNRKIGRSVDAFFPSMYVHDTNRRAWATAAKKLVREGHRYHKPVYLFLMPKFHGRKGKDVPASFWMYELRTAKRVGADGVVIWSSDRSRWSERAGWWQATKRFASETGKTRAAT